MFRIPCPYCGVRHHAVFCYGGDASPPRPGQAETDAGVWADYVFIRDNPRGPLWEYWHHAHGCRQWLRVERDTLTHDILRALPAREKTPAPEETGGEPS